MEARDRVLDGRDPSRGPTAYSPGESSQPSAQPPSHTGLDERVAATSGNHFIPQSPYVPAFLPLQHSGMQMAASVPQQAYPTGASPAASSATSLVADIPPPLPVPLLAVTDAGGNGMPPALKPVTVSPTNARSSSTASAGSPAVSADMMAQFAGFNAMHAAMGISSTGRDRSSSRGTEGGAKKSSSPEKLQGSDPRASQHGLTSTHPRLKVEDALGYLDRVKVIFSHKPKVYNDFLDIMKEFKSQSLDTPGVIGRVAQLFRGHNELIVGFNAFLPHGYKIDIDGDKVVRVTLPNIGGSGSQVVPLSELMPPSPPPMASSAMEPFTPSSSVKPQSPASTDTASDDDDDDTKLTEDSPRGRSQSAHEDPSGMSDVERIGSFADMPGLSDSNGRALANAGGAPSKGVEFDYAINYVNKIKNRFKDEPHRYKRFLEILHAYQGKIRLTGDKPLDETDVYKEVNRLFGDHSDLMDDFSRFLPNACGLGGPMTPPPAPSIRTSSPSRSASSSPQLPAIQEFRNQNRGLKVTGAGKRKSNQGDNSGQYSGQRGAGSNQRDNDRKGKGGRARGKASEDPEEMETSKPPGKRFHKQISRDSRAGKNEALDMSKKTGRNPSGNAKGSVASRARMQQEPTIVQAAVVKTIKPPPVVNLREEERMPEEPPTRGVKSKRLPYRPAIPLQRKRPKRASEPKKVFRPARTVSTAEAFGFATLDDFNLMYRLQRAVPVGVWHVLLKMFELYTSRALTKGKLLDIVEKLLYHKPKLIQEFAALLQTKAVIRNLSTESAVVPTVVKVSTLAESDPRRSLLPKMRDPENRMAEFDFKAFERYTDSRSYRIRPDTLVKRKSSGSSAMDKEVLNDKYVSCPMFSEGSQFTISKKNSAEEVMFKCEDEKYEMDMLLSAAEAAIDAMTFMKERLSVNSVADRNATWEEAGLHRRIITKLYAENAPIIMNHLINNPACSVPTVLERLKQKHSQWIRVQNGMSEIWMEQARKNASKIGDYKGTTFKQTDMRFLRSRHLVHEMEKLYNERLDHSEKTEGQAKKKPEDDTTKKKPEDDANKAAPVAPVEKPVSDNQPHLTVKYPKSVIAIDDVSFFVLRYLKQSSAFHHSEKKQMTRFLLEYLFRCFKIPDSTEVKENYDSSDDESDNEGKTARPPRPAIPRLSPSTTDDERSEEPGPSRSKSGKSDGASSGTRKSRSMKEFPMLPLPWPELCHYTSDFKPLDAQVDEDLTNEAKRREENRERIVRRLVALGNRLPDEESSYVLVYGNAPFFLFCRYHQILCDRFNTLYQSFQSLLTMETGKQDTPAYIVSKACKPRIDVPVERFWIVFVDRLLKLLDGKIDPNTYEEEMREIFRKDAYLSFTLDRLLQSVTRQLHHIVAQDKTKTIRNYWDEAAAVGGAGGSITTQNEREEAEKQYENKVSEFLKDQNCFKMVVHNNGRVGLELIDSEEPEDLQPQCKNWKDFLVYYAPSSNLEESVKARLLQRMPLFIVRQHRQFSRHGKQIGAEIDEEEEEEDEDLPLDVSKAPKREAPTELSLDDRSWLMTINIRSQVESGDVLGRADDRVPHTEWSVYRRGALKTAKEVHRRVSQRRTAAFKRYMTETWMKKALISQEKHKAFLSLMRETLNRYKLGNSVSAPYFVYYVCRSDESERADDRKPFWVEQDDETKLDDVGQSEKEETVVDTAQSETSDEEKDEDTETEGEHESKKAEQRSSMD